MPGNGPDWVYSPREWAAEVNYDAWTDRYTPDDAVALHHGGAGDYRAGRPPYSVSQEMAQLRSWERYHLGKGWRGLAYGWGVGMSGAGYRIRGWGTYGAHTGDLDGDGVSNNVEVIPLIVIGSGNLHDLSPAAQTTIARLRQYIEAESRRSLRLYGHLELRGSKTTCPGPKFMEYVRTHRIFEEDDLATAKEIVDELMSRKIWYSGFGSDPNESPQSYEQIVSRDDRYIRELAIAHRKNRLGVSVDVSVNVEQLADEIADLINSSENSNESILNALHARLES